MDETRLFYRSISEIDKESVLRIMMDPDLRSSQRFKDNILFNREIAEASLPKKEYDSINICTWTKM